MTQSRDSTADRFAKALGASRTVSLEGVSAQGPIGLLWLRAAVAREVRLAEPATATVAAEQVRALEPERWHHIKRLAADLCRSGPPMDPLELAARLIEHGLLVAGGGTGPSSESAPYCLTRSTRGSTPLRIASSRWKRREFHGEFDEGRRGGDDHLVP